MLAGFAERQNPATVAMHKKAEGRNPTRLPRVEPKPFAQAVLITFFASISVQNPSAPDVLPDIKTPLAERPQSCGRDSLRPTAGRE